MKLHLFYYLFVCIIMNQVITINGETVANNNDKTVDDLLSRYKRQLMETEPSSTTVHCEYMIISKDLWKSSYFNLKSSIYLYNGHLNIRKYYQSIQYLKTNCLDESINTFINEQLNNRSYVFGIDLSNNLIDNKILKLLFEKNLFLNKYGNFIRYLDLSRNNLTFDTSNTDTTATAHRGEPLLFDSLTNLQILLLDGNSHLNLYDNLFSNLANLKILSLNKCNLNVFNWRLFSKGLQTLDYFGLSGNGLTSIKNEYLPLFIETLDLSNNKFTKIDNSLLLCVISFINLENNLITKFDAIDLIKPGYVNLNVKFNLRHNLIESTRYDLYHHTSKLHISLYLSGNPLLCDCNSVWLLDHLDNNETMTRILDINELECNFLDTKDNWIENEINNNNKLVEIAFNKRGDFATIRNVTLFKDSFSILKQTFQTRHVRLVRQLIVKSEFNDFMCIYKDRCNKGCECCNFACNCQSICPSNCNCYMNFDSTENIIDCSNRNLTDTNILTYVESATELRLNNNLLKEAQLFGYINLKRLLLQNNFIDSIPSSMFIYQSGDLEYLDLSHNLIETIDGNEFKMLQTLQTLKLFNNSIKNIENINSLYSFNLVNLRHIDMDDNYFSHKSLALLQEYAMNNPNVQISYSISKKNKETTTTTTNSLVYTIGVALPSTPIITTTESTTTTTTTAIPTTTPSVSTTTITDESSVVITAVITGVGISDRSSEAMLSKINSSKANELSYDFWNKDLTTTTLLLFQTIHFNRYEILRIMIIVIPLGCFLLCVLIIVIHIFCSLCRRTTYKPNGGGQFMTNYGRLCKSTPNDHDSVSSMDSGEVESCCYCCMSTGGYNLDTILVSEVEDVRLNVYVYYNYMDRKFVNDCIKPVLDRVKIEINANIYWKQQQNEYVDEESSTSSTLVVDMSTTSTNISTTKTNEQIYQNISTTTRTPTRHMSSNSRLNAHLFVISSNFHGYKNTTSQVIRFEGTKSLHKTRLNNTFDNVYKIDICGTKFDTNTNKKSTTSVSLLRKYTTKPSKYSRKCVFQSTEHLENALNTYLKSLYKKEKSNVNFKYIDNRKSVIETTQNSLIINSSTINNDSEYSDPFTS